MLGVDLGLAVLAGFVAGKENDAPRFLGVTFKHLLTPLLRPFGCCASNINIPARR